MKHYREENGQVYEVLPKRVPLMRYSRFPCIVSMYNENDRHGQYIRHAYPSSAREAINHCVGINESGLVRFDHESKIGAVFDSGYYLNFDIVGYPIDKGTLPWAEYNLTLRNSVSCVNENNEETVFTKDGNKIVCYANGEKKYLNSLEEAPCAGDNVEWRVHRYATPMQYKVYKQVHGRSAQCLDKVIIMAYCMDDAIKDFVDWAIGWLGNYGFPAEEVRKDLIINPSYKFTYDSCDYWVEEP